MAAAVLAGCSSAGDDANGTTTSADAGAGATSSSAAGAKAGGGTFDLLSYNVAGLPQEISKEQPSTHLPMISPKLNDFQVVMTQEDFDWWAKLASGFDFVNYHTRLRADTTHEYQSPKHPGPDAVGLDLTSRPAPEVGDGLGILSTFEITGNDRVPWVGCFGGMDTSDGGAGDCLSMKGFQHMVLHVGDGREVDLYNLHGEAGGSETDQKLQADDFAQLAAYIAEHSKGRAVIVGGDTNLHTGGDHPDGASGADLKIWTTFLDAAGLTDSCAATDCPDETRIDKVAFRSGEGVDLDVTSHRFLDWKDPEGADLSDHDPLAVTVAWSPT